MKPLLIGILSGWVIRSVWQWYWFNKDRWDANKVKPAPEPKHQPRPARHPDSFMITCFGLWPDDTKKAGDLVGWFNDDECWVEDRHYLRDR